MTKGNLYYYFKNKEEILYACHDYSLDVLLALMAEVQAEPSNPDDKLRKLILAFIHLMLDELQGTALTLDLAAVAGAAASFAAGEVLVALSTSSALKARSGPLVHSETQYPRLDKRDRPRLQRRGRALQR